MTAGLERRQRAKIRFLALNVNVIEGYISLVGFPCHKSLSSSPQLVLPTPNAGLGPTFESAMPSLVLHEGRTLLREVDEGGGSVHKTNWVLGEQAVSRSPFHHTTDR